MRAVIFKDKLEYFSDYTKPSIEKGWAVVKVLKAGICNTDLEIIKGYMGFKGILGHEFVGIVEECSNTEWLGKRVAGEINFGCNNCEWCKCGLGRHCPNRTTLGISNADGCMADYCKIPIDCLIEIPDNISNNKAVFIEPLSAACEILEQLENNITGKEKVIILGDGKLGILCSWVLTTAFEDVTLVGRHKSKLELASWNRLKTTTDINSISSADIVVEATGTSGGFNTAINICKPRGKIILKSTVADQKPVNMTKIVVDEISVIGSRCGQFKDGLTVMKNYLDIPLDKLITATFSAEKSLEAFEKSAKKGMLKIIIDFTT
jgi:alcohol dehydrogenase